MARQTIDIGTNNNDGTGDKLRDAMRKVNENFAELYGQSAAETNVSISSNSISVDNTNGDLTLEPNGSGELLVTTGATFNTSEQPLGHVIVKADDGSDVLTVNTQYRNVGINATANDQGLSVAGNATITGSAVTLNANVTLGANSTNTTTFNGKVNSSITPFSNDLYDLGTPIASFRTAYIANIESNDITSTEVTATNANIGNVVTTGDTTIGNLLIRTNQISNNVSNQDIEIKPYGTGNLVVNTRLVVGNITVGSGSDTGENVQIRNSTRFSSTVAIAQNAPSTSVGVAGDETGMIAWNSSYIYVCTGDYDGSTAIWKRSSLGSW